MPLQNRVTPFGEIVALDQRGLFTGNRGIIHDPKTKRLLRKRWATKSWLICSCDYKGIRRQIMAGRSWTELFFLDEATALAAGHRPCFLCRREDAERFRSAWARGNGGGSPSAIEIDDILHSERLGGGRERLVRPPRSSPELPDGIMLALEDRAFVVTNGVPSEWNVDGYRPVENLLGAVDILTPPSTVRTLIAGYRPVLHPSLLDIQQAGYPA